MKRKILKKTSAAALALAAGMAALTVTAAAEENENVFHVVVDRPLDADKLDACIYSGDMLNYELIYDPLVRYGEGGVYEPGLAESWEISEDGKEYTFHLRQDVKFSDGSDFNADNVLFNVDRWKGQSTTASMNVVNNLDSIEKIDDYTVKFIFTKAYYPYLTEFTYSRPLRFMAQSALDDEGNFVQPVGTGPWMLESFEGNSCTLVPNPNYYGEKPKADKMVSQFVPDVESRIMALQSGEIDINYNSLPTDSLNTLTQDDSLEVYEVEGTSSIMLTFNYEKELFQDVNIRKAFSYAIDKDEIAASIYDGKGLPAEGVFPKTVAYVTDENSKSYEYDPEKAKECFAEAGWTDTDGDGILDKDGLPMELSFLVLDEYKNLAEYLQAKFMEIGVMADLRQVDGATYSDITYGTRDYDINLEYTYSGAWNPAGTLSFKFFKTGEKKPSSWSSDEFNELFDAVLSTTEDADRQAKYDALYDYLYEDACVVPIFYPETIYVYNKRLSNVQAAPSADKAILWENIEVGE